MTDEMLNAIREIVRNEIALHNAPALSPSLAVHPVEALRAEIERLNARINVLRETNKNAVDENSMLQAEIEELNARVNVLRETNKNAVDENSMLHAQVQAAQRTIDALGADLARVWRMYNTREHGND